MYFSFLFQLEIFNAISHAIKNSTRAGGNVSHNLESWFNLEAPLVANFYFLFPLSRLPRI